MATLVYLKYLFDTNYGTFKYLLFTLFLQLFILVEAKTNVFLNLFVKIGFHWQKWRVPQGVYFCQGSMFNFLLHLFLAE